MTHYREIICPDCATKSFMLEYRYRAYKPDIKAQLVDMAINGSGVRCWSQVQSALVLVYPRAQVPLTTPPIRSCLMCLANGRMTFLKTLRRWVSAIIIYAPWVHR